MQAYFRVVVASFLLVSEVSTLQSQEPPLNPEAPPAGEPLIIGNLPQSNSITVFETSGEIVRNVKQPKRTAEVRQLYDATYRQFAISMLNGRLDEVSPTAGNSAEELRAELLSISDIHLAVITQYQDNLTLAEKGRLSQREIAQTLAEVNEYRLKSDLKVEEALKKHLDRESYDAIVDGMIRKSIADYFDCGLIAKELELSEKQLQGLRSIRAREIKAYDGFDLSSFDSNVKPSGEQAAQLASIMEKIGRDSVRIFDILAAEQIERAWRASGILQKDENIDDFLKKRSAQTGFERFVSGSKVLTERWNKLFPDRAIASPETNTNAENSGR